MHYLFLSLRMAHESAVKQMKIKPSSRVSPFPDHYFNGTSGYISNLEVLLLFLLMSL